MKKKKTVSERLDERIQAECKSLIEEYNLEKDPEIRLEIQYDILKSVTRTIIVQLSRLTEKDWRHFLKEQTKPLEEWIEKTSKDILEQKLRHGELGLQDIGLLYTQAELLGSWRLSKPESSALRKRRTIERLFALMYVSYVGLSFQVGIIAVNLEPFSQINSMVSRRFGADQNWTIAVALLATHENLVKKKLSDLGVTSDRIEHVSRQGGFAPLLALLEKEIEGKEKRQLSLTFHKSSSLRAVRNRLEHQGYKQMVKREELIDLVKEITRFETELFFQK